MINTAVILAARKESDSQVPYPLMVYNKKNEKPEHLMNRHLQLLAEVGINKIIIVTGYCADLFEQFESDNVRCVENPNFANTSSMASLALAGDLIDDDFLLIESDVIYEKKLLEKLLESSDNNCFTIVNECGNGDEAFVEVDNNRISKMSKDIHQLNSIDGEMVGVSKISLDTFKKMLIKWGQNHNLKMNYEYLFLDCTEKHERHFVRYPDLIWCEVDNKADFAYLQDKLYRRLCRKEDPFNRDNLLSHLRDIFPNADFGQNLIIEQIGGMTNRNFKVSLDGQTYVLRVPGNGTEGMVERRNEEINNKLSCKMGISPGIVYFNETNGVKLTNFIEGAETLNRATIQRYENLIQVADIFKTLHNSSVRLNNDFNVFREILNYEDLLQKANAKMYEGYDDIRNSVFALQDRLNILGIELKPCHNDLVPENFIADYDGRLFLIDWEYSGMNDPMWDFAALFLESEFCESSKEIVLNRYFEGSTDEIIKEKILIYQILMDILWSIWTCIKEAKGDDFGTYGIDRYSRALRNLNVLNINNTKK